MSRDNDAQKLRGQLAVMRSLWDYEREQILQVLGLEINPRTWSTFDLVEEIKDCIEGHRMLASVSNPEPPANKLAQPESPVNESENPAVTREEVEDWLNDQPLFGT